MASAPGDRRAGPVKQFRRVHGAEDDIRHVAREVLRQLPDAVLGQEDDHGRAGQFGMLLDHDSGSDDGEQVTAFPC